MSEPMTFDPDRLEEQTEAAIENRLSPLERDELKSTVLRDPAALAFYGDRLLDHAMLCAQAEEGALDLDEMRFLLDVPSPNPRPERPCSEINRTKTFFPGKRWIGIGATVLSFALIASLLLAVSGFSNKRNDSFASIIRTTNCLWADSPTKTSPGSRLGRCTLRLEEGIALVHFDCDTAVSLEGPCVFELKNPRQAVLHSGRLVAEVLTPEGRGFVIDTPRGSIRDLGTKFALYAPENKPANVYVLDGTVEVYPEKEAGPVFLSKGSSFFLGMSAGDSSTAPEPESDIVQVTSAMGRGKETWVVMDMATALSAERLFPLGVTEPYMLVKLSCENDEKADRKAVFRIDLSALKPGFKTLFSAVSLCLSYGPTELGYASSVPDSTFTVYGLIDDSLDDWNEKISDWNDLPGNEERAAMNPECWRPLGSFSIKQGSRSGSVQINGEKLKDFVRNDRNDLLTFAIVRETPATAERGLVHGFANRHHPTLMPPRLVFQFNEH